MVVPDGHLLILYNCVFGLPLQKPQTLQDAQIKEREKHEDPIKLKVTTHTTMCFHMHRTRTLFFSKEMCCCLNCCACTKLLT